MNKRLKLLWWIFNPYWFFIPLFYDIRTRYKYLPHEFYTSIRVLRNDVKHLIRAKLNPEIYEALENKENEEFCAWFTHSQKA